MLMQFKNNFQVYFKVCCGQSMVSNAALRSSNTNREIQPRSDDKNKSFVTD